MPLLITELAHLRTPTPRQVYDCLARDLVEPHTRPGADAYGASKMQVR